MTGGVFEAWMARNQEPVGVYEWPDWFVEMFGKPDEPAPHPSFWDIENLLTRAHQWEKEEYGWSFALDGGPAPEWYRDRIKKERDVYDREFKTLEDSGMEIRAASREASRRMREWSDKRQWPRGGHANHNGKIT